MENNRIIPIYSEPRGSTSFSRIDNVTVMVNRPQIFKKDILPPILEPILDSKNNRINIYPIQYEDIWDMYVKSKAAIWFPEEIDFSGDMKDWNTLSNDEKFFLSRVLIFFASSDFIVDQNLDTGFCEQVQIPELKFFYHFQAMMEDIHSDTYIRLINTYLPEAERKEVFTSLKDLDNNDKFDYIKDKIKWCKKWINIDETFVRRLLAFIITECIFFAGSFAAIFYMKKRGLLPALSMANKFIARDETIHFNLGCLVYKKYIVHKLHEDEVIEMFREAVKIEERFICESIPCELIGMNKNLMIQYIHYTADNLLYELIGQKLYNETNPFTWMSLLQFESKANFFEVRNSSYAHQMSLTDPKDHKIVFDAEF